MILKNSEIYSMAKLLNEAFMGETQYLPAKLYFFIQKNKNKLTSLAVSIEEAR
ncbi:MAG: hypothetical protein IJ341_10380 [Bacteroidales bacterium]|nr:hypothetical protein [Bacteroidales bacterium]